MKELLILWDPANPLVPASPVVDALASLSDVRVKTRTFEEIGHPTLPNQAFQLRPSLHGEEPDAILWIEGGPLPSDLPSFRCPKACWLVNTHLEPTLLDQVGSQFDSVFSTSLGDTENERACWLPLAPGGTGSGAPPSGISILVDDPRPPLHAEVEEALFQAVRDLGPIPVPLVVALGNAGQVHPALFDCLRAGVAVLADPESDLRGIAHVGEHLDVYPSKEGLADFVRTLVKDPERLSRLAARGPEIVQHLHEPGLRAARICQELWPHERILSGQEHRPRISILVTCYRYLRRFRVCLESLARQDLPPGSLEIVVADPGSPDGLAVALEEFAAKYPDIRVVHLPLDRRYHRNRGVGINRAFDVCMGQVVIGIDGDLVFPPKLIGLLEERVLGAHDRVFGVRRIFVGKEETESILRGELDPFAQFDRLSQSEGDGEKNSFVGVLGYCQAVHRDAFARARYPEEFDVVNQSDIVFVERLAKKAQVSPEYLKDQTALHLWHPRNWMGTNESL